MKVRKIPEFPSFYASKCGKIFSDTLRGYKLAQFREVKSFEDGNYLCVNVKNEHTKYKLPVHRLVLKTYVGKPPGNQSKIVKTW